MRLLTPQPGLIVWTMLSAIVCLLTIGALIHLLLNKRMGRQESLGWLLAIVFVPIFGALLYFKSARQHKQFQ